MSWNDLTLKEKAAYMKVAVKNGLTDIDSISTAYNEFADGGFKIKMTTPDTHQALTAIKKHMENYAPSYEFKGGYRGGDFGGAGAGVQFDAGPLVASLADLPNKLPQYVENTPIPVQTSFTEAFARARKDGKKEFVFNGKRYTTDISDNPKYSKKEYETSLANVRKVLDYNKQEMPDSTRIKPYVGQIPGEELRDVKDYNYSAQYIDSHPLNKHANGGYLDNLTTRPFSYSNIPVVRFAEGGQLVPPPDVAFSGGDINGAKVTASAHNNFTSPIEAYKLDNDDLGNIIIADDDPNYLKAKNKALNKSAEAMWSAFEQFNNNETPINQKIYKAFLNNKNKYTNYTDLFEAIQDEVWPNYSFLTLQNKYTADYEHFDNLLNGYIEENRKNLADSLHYDKGLYLKDNINNPDLQDKLVQLNNYQTDVLRGGDFVYNLYDNKRILRKAKRNDEYAKRHGFTPPEYKDHLITVGAYNPITISSRLNDNSRLNSYNNLFLSNKPAITFNPLLSPQESYNRYLNGTITIGANIFNSKYNDLSLPYTFTPQEYGAHEVAHNRQIFNSADSDGNIITSYYRPKLLKALQPVNILSDYYDHDSRLNESVSDLFGLRANLMYNNVNGIRRRYTNKDVINYANTEEGKKNRYLLTHGVINEDKIINKKEVRRARKALNNVYASGGAFEDYSSTAGLEGTPEQLATIQAIADANQAKLHQQHLEDIEKAKTSRRKAGWKLKAVDTLYGLAHAIPNTGLMLDIADLWSSNRNTSSKEDVANSFAGLGLGTAGILVPTTIKREISKKAIKDAEMLLKGFKTIGGAIGTAGLIVDDLPTIIKAVAANPDTYESQYFDDGGHLYGFGDWLKRLFTSPKKDENFIDVEELALRQGWAESKFVPKAKSKRGAMGDYQIMPDTLNEYIAKTGDEGDIYDSTYNRKVRDWYVNWLGERPYLKRANNDRVKWAKIMAAYNWGNGNVLNALNKAKADGYNIYDTTDWLTYTPKETQDYVNFIVNNIDTGGHRVDSLYQGFKKLRKNSK